MKKIHILGICGTFMGSLALIARKLGYEVSGSDIASYPPMGDLLEAQGIQVFKGYDREQLEIYQPDEVIVGNTMKRGVDIIEAMMERRIPLKSGPQWLYENVLRYKRVIAISGTHGKTTTTSMLVKIFEHAGLNPGFLIGGVANDYDVSARVTDSEWFVIEADEYDTAFFDKRSKFVHYFPEIAIINNIEFDHGDIFNHLDEIKRQFHHLIRSVPPNGCLIINAEDDVIADVLIKGVWSPVISFGLSVGNWQAKLLKEDASEFEIYFKHKKQGVIKWDLIGLHNTYNALAAVSASFQAGIEPDVAIDALSKFQGVKRRLEEILSDDGVTVYDDFAHHPTAIKSTLNAVRANIGKQQLIAILEPRSNTMKMGTHGQRLVDSLNDADYLLLFQPEGVQLKWSDMLNGAQQRSQIFHDVDTLVAYLPQVIQKPSHIVIMSNGSFDGIYKKIKKMLV
ncbi:UDP-N-acetylmuramate:L-alanyl-gamma-D-glutamyl-meso-diaminopimelate ligase [Thiotrichales bacterium 19S11-10]|nr:UDP-N-acetylmuramate:L-alanyl-gamma-D-glutamyl-meso-diaminopimelate ligase [Thiotrichales bacterium 19S11-10]MCF6807219.1 UDP-N-acetylmuramate:L-alanyl-gamma-D-glutamyl-meso-diaminopimelate ligase [Thiotrichales bacterium 19S9-11]MCF6811188.1 UDP-N-acetylmuramate:L-alanyl-gamma-D-glutamyl-meso-diaminopimelate ligase [Thiotrichales bacterium 19S9-12]